MPTPSPFLRNRSVNTSQQTYTRFYKYIFHLPFYNLGGTSVYSDYIFFNYIQSDPLKLVPNDDGVPYFIYPSNYRDTNGVDHYINTFLFGYYSEQIATNPPINMQGIAEVIGGSVRTYESTSYSLPPNSIATVTNVNTSTMPDHDAAVAFYIASNSSRFIRVETETAPVITSIASSYYNWQESKFYLRKPEIKDYFTGYYLDNKQYKCLCDIKYKSTLKGKIRICWQTLTGEIQVDADGVSTPTVDTRSQLFEIDKDWINFAKDVIPCSVKLTGDTALIQEFTDNLSVSSSTNSYDASFILFDTNSLKAIKSNWIALHNNRVANELANLPASGSPSVSIIENRKYVWAANNNRWGNTRTRSNLNTGTGIGENVPVAWLYAKFLAPQPDGTYGSYIMPDSARVIELHHYLVGNNATYIDANGDVKPNQFTGWWQIKNIAKVLGLRRDNELKIDRPAEKKILRDRLNNPKYDDSDYSIACWGDEGMVLPFMPTEYDPKTGQLQERYDVVHDFLQLLAAYHDQHDRADPIRLGAEIRVKRGETIASFPNKLSLLIDTADRIAKIEAMMERTLLAGLVSSNEIREMWTGIGIPITHKSLPVELDGKKQLLPYVGHQAGKPTLIDRLAEIAMNIAIQTGQLMPRKSAKTPFDRFLPPKQKK